MKIRRADLPDKKTVVDGIKCFSYIQTKHSGPCRRLLLVEAPRDVGREGEKRGNG